GLGARSASGHGNRHGQRAGGWRARSLLGIKSLEIGSDNPTTGPNDDAMASANKRGCRCGGSETSPGGQEAAGLPRGYCGLCVMCSKPGHSRHHPGAVRFTGAWCDFHYRVLAVIHPLAPVGTFLWLAVIASVIFVARHLVQ